MYRLDNGDRLYGFLEKFIFVQSIENHEYWKQHFFEQGVDNGGEDRENVHEKLITSFHNGPNEGLDYSHFEESEIRPRLNELTSNLMYTKRLDRLGWWHQNYVEGGYHGPHDHKSHTISGIYILELEKENTTVFYSQNDDREYSFVLDDVKEGDLILFDSTVWHSVDPNDGKKIVLCFNSRN